MAVNATGGSATNTFFFAEGGGKDTIDFGTQTSAFSRGSTAFTIAVDSACMVQLLATTSIALQAS